MTNDTGTPPSIPPRKSAAPQLLWGLGIGSAVSAIVWLAGWNALFATGRSADWLLVAIPGGKIVAGIACVVTPRWRSFGIGLLLSIAVGFLIFFGACFVHIAAG